MFHLGALVTRRATLRLTSQNMHLASKLYSDVELVSIHYLQAAVINPWRMREGYHSHSVCVCVLVDRPV